MRVLIDCRMADWSGIGRYTTGLVRALASRGDIELVQVVAAGGSTPAMNAEAVSAKAHPFTPAGGFELGRIARRVTPDVTHCLHFPTPVPARHPLVVTIHDLTPILVPGAMRPFPHGIAYRLWNSRASKIADGMVTPSACTATDVQRLFPSAAHKVRVTPEAADDFTGGSIGALPPAAVEAPYILSMGNARPHKDLPTLLRAFEMISAKHPSMRLLLVGAETPDFVASVLADAPRIASRVRFTGRVSDPELRALYANAIAFAFPSTYEGFGLPPLEAMSFGAPVICSDAASLPEVVGGAALVFPAGDVAALARSLTVVVDDPALRHELRTRGLARAATFTWDRTARETIAVYREVLSR